MRSRAGDWVEVRSKEEILATLDAQGRLDRMPFMPEMFAYCGKRLRVHRRAHKGCDTINPIRSRALAEGVMLDGVRCDGSGHGGCQAACTVMWKEAWLKPADAPDEPERAVAAPGQGCTEDDVAKATRNGETAAGKPVYRCQATDYPEYTTQLRTRNLGQFIEDYVSRNVGLGEMAMSVFYFVYDFVMRPERKSRALSRKIYNWFQGLWGGVPYPRLRGERAVGEEPSAPPLDLQPGELVRVKSFEDILSTLNTENKNIGLMFDAEMVPYCGGVFRVRSRVDHFLDERTGAMRTMKTPAVILDNVWCLARFSNRRLFCPRAIYAWWREAWLERAPEAAEPSVENALGRRAILAGLAAEKSS